MQLLCMKVNSFLHLTGYDRQDVVDRNCRFLQSPVTDSASVAHSGLGRHVLGPSWSRDPAPVFSGSSWRRSPSAIQHLIIKHDWRFRVTSAFRDSSPTKRVVTRRSTARRNDGDESWVLANAGRIRDTPLAVGVGSLLAVLLNRSFSGIAAIADASSAQSRADVLVVALSATLILTGLVWKSIEPKRQFPVALEGIECMKVFSGLPDGAARELLWAWETLAGATSVAALVVVYGRTCVLQAGLAAEGSEQGTVVPVDVAGLLGGSLCAAVRTSNKQMYLANLALYPGRFELPFLPSNTQAVIIQSLGSDGVMIVGSDTLRGFGPSDQGWIVAIAEKLDSTLADTVFAGVGKTDPESEVLRSASEQLPSI